MKSNKFNDVILLDSHYRTKTFIESFSGFEFNIVFSNKYEKVKAFKNYSINEINTLDISNYYNKKIINNPPLQMSELQKMLYWDIKDIILSDRRLSLFSSKYALNYLLWVANKYYSFIKNKKFTKNTLLFLEPTWAHELIISQMSKRLGFTVLAPMKCKINKNRFYFFFDWDNFKFFPNQINKKENDLEKFINKYENEIKKSSLESIPFFSEDASKNKINIRLIKIFFRLIYESFTSNRNKNIHSNIFIEFFKKLKNILRFYYYKNKKNFWSPFIFNNNSFNIYIPLHYQPEASINVIGFKYIDQIKFIEKISKQLEVKKNIKILVKEHPHCLGNRKFNYYNKLKNIKNVILLNPQIDSRDIIKKSNFVITIAGTASLEASILKIPSITGVKMYFSKLLLKDEFDLEKDNIIDLLNGIKKWKKYRLSNKWKMEFKYIMDSAFVGNFSDYKSSPDVFSKDNLLNIRSSIQMILK